MAGQTSGNNTGETIYGTTGADKLKGLGGNDTFYVYTGKDTVDGGQGTDTVVFSGTHLQYMITPKDTGNLKVTVVGLGSDAELKQVEAIRFSDGTYDVASGVFTPTVAPLPLVSVVATDGVGTEAVDGTDFTFTFARTGSTASALTVSYSIFPAPINGATPGADFPTQTGMITFAAGSSTAVLQFSAIDDAIVENTELFSVVIGAGAGYQVDIPNATANASIVDNDVFLPAVVSLTPAVAATTEGGALTFTFTRTGGDLSQSLTINYVVNDGPPLGGATRAEGDFNYPSGMQQLTFAAGQTTATITVQTNDDATVETDESFPVLLAGGVDYTVDPVNNGSTAVIHDNDVAPALPVISVVATDGVGTETVDGTDFTFTFSRTGSTASALTVNYSISPAPIDGATPGADFPAQSGTITFAAGDSTAVLQFSATHDAVVENTEFFSVLVSPGAGYQVDVPNATANASIADGTIYGTELADNLVGTNDPDAIVALGGNDSLSGGLGADFLDGGSGSDRALYTNAGAAVNIQLAPGTATIGGTGGTVDTLRSIELARGTAFDDTFNAGGFGPGSSPNASSEGNNFNGFEGLAGNDHIFGNGNTRVEYTNSSSAVTVTFTTATATGSSGTASGSGSGNDDFTGVRDVRGSQFNDLIINFGNTNNTFDGQGGFDTVSYANLGLGINANLDTGNVFAPGSIPGWTDSLRDIANVVTIEGIIGTAFNDIFTGNGGANSFDGGGGADIAVFGGIRSASSIIDNGIGGATVTPVTEGTDTLTNVELLQFSDAYQLTSAGLNANLTGVSLPGVNPIFGNDFNETITIGTNFNAHTVDLLGGTDTVLLGLPSAQTYNLGLAGVEFLTGRNDSNENVFLTGPVNGLIVDLAAGSDRLTLAIGNGDNVVTAISVETIQGSFGNDTVTFVLNDGSVNQQISLLSGTNVLNLEGTTSNYSLTLDSITLLNGHAGLVNDNLNVLNLQLGTVFDLGHGVNDELHLNTSPIFPGGPNGVNVVTVYNTENVFGALAFGDQIHLGGNSDGNVTTVTAGLGPDMLWASNDSDHFRFTTTGDSANDVPGGGQRDLVNDFDASEDAFVFDHIAGATSLTWEDMNFGGSGGSHIVLVDLNGDATPGNPSGYDMAIQLQNHVGALSDSNFILII